MLSCVDKYFSAMRDKARVQCWALSVAAIDEDSTLETLPHYQGFLNSTHFVFTPLSSGQTAHALPIIAWNHISLRLSTARISLRRLVSDAHLSQHDIVLWATIILVYVSYYWPSKQASITKQSPVQPVDDTAASALPISKYVSWGIYATLNGKHKSEAKHIIVGA